jgi:sugar phosphate isomerase/epimerase
MAYYCCPLDQALARLGAHGVDKVELCSMGHEHYDLRTATDREAEQAARLADRAGVRIVAVNLGAPCRLDADYRPLDTAYANAWKVLRLAKTVGAEVATMGCGTLVAAGEDRARKLAALAAFHREVADLAAGLGVTFCIEAPHKHSIAEKSAEVAEYWQAHDATVRCTFDMAHIMFAGDDPLAEARRRRDRVAHIHLRDAVPGNSRLPFGEGQIDFKTIVGVFKEIGYSGYYSLEFPVEQSAEAADERLVKNLDYFAGFAF